jgi:hypothetical protein
MFRCYERIKRQSLRLHASLEANCDLLIGSSRIMHSDIFTSTASVADAMDHGCSGTGPEGLCAIKWAVKDQLTPKTYRDPEVNSEAYVADFDFGILEGLMGFAYDTQSPTDQAEGKRINPVTLPLLWRGRNTEVLRDPHNENIGEIGFHET